MIEIEGRVRLATRLFDYDMIAIRDFCRETDSLFKRRIARLKANIIEWESKKHDEYDEMFWSDLHMELEEQRNLGSYFGLLMLFSGLERYVHRLYEDAVFECSKPEFRGLIADLSYKWLPFDIKRFLKIVGVQNLGRLCDWRALDRIHRLRNAIVHQGGDITAANIHYLQSHGYKVGQKIELSAEDVKEAIQLATVTVKIIGPAFAMAMLRK